MNNQQVGGVFLLGIFLFVAFSDAPDDCPLELASLPTSLPAEPPQPQPQPTAQPATAQPATAQPSTAQPVAVQPTAHLGGAVVTVNEESSAQMIGKRFYNGTMFCQLPGPDGELRALRRRGSSAPKAWSFDLYRQSEINLKDVIPAMELPVQARVVDSQTVLWVLHDMGLQFNLAHLNFDLLIPVMAARLHYIGMDKRIVFHVTVPLKGWAIPLLSTIAGPDQPPVTRVTPVNETTCFENVYAGFPYRYSKYPTKESQLLSSVSRQCWTVADRLREEFYKYGRNRGVALPPIEPVPPASVRKPHLILTYRLINPPPGFGRNITNTEELMEVVRQPRWSEKLTAELVAWETMPMLKQMEKAATAHILAGVHGQNLAWNIMMRPGSVMLQFFSFGASMLYQGINPASWDTDRLFERDLFCLKSTAINWASRTPTDSPMEPEEKWVKLFSHRCKPRSNGKMSKAAWMCRNLTMRLHIWESLLTIALEHVGQFNSSFWVGGRNTTDTSWLSYEAARGHRLE